MATKDKPTAWRSYEEVSAHLLNMLAAELGFDRVEGTQKVKGRRSGTDWAIDAKGVMKDGKGFVVIEVRHTKRRQNQNNMGGLAYSILDTGAEGGIIVSPLPLQKGAKKIAAAENIMHVQIDQNSTIEEFGIKFLNKIFVGVVAKATATATCSATVMRTCRRCSKGFEPVSSEVLCNDCGSETSLAPAGII